MRTACGRCGAAVEDPAFVFCAHCGARVGPDTPPVVAEPVGAADATTVARPAMFGYEHAAAPSFAATTAVAATPDPGVWTPPPPPDWPPVQGDPSSPPPAEASRAPRAIAAHAVLWGALVLLSIGAAIWIAQEGPYYYDFFRGTEARIRGYGAAVLGFTAFVIAALLVPTTPARRLLSIGIVLVVAVFGLYSPQFFSFDPWQGHGLPRGAYLDLLEWGVAIPLLLTAWLILRNRAPAAFLLVPVSELVPAVLHWEPAIERQIAKALGSWPAIPDLVFFALEWPLIIAAFGLIAAKFFPGAVPVAGAKRQPQFPAGAAAARGPYPSPYGTFMPYNPIAIVGFVLSFFVAIAGVVCGHVALSQIKRTGERGRGLAIAALVIGYVGVALVIGYVVVLVALLKSS